MKTIGRILSILFVCFFLSGCAYGGAKGEAQSGGRPSAHAAAPNAHKLFVAFTPAPARPAATPRSTPTPTLSPAPAALPSPGVTPEPAPVREPALSLTAEEIKRLAPTTGMTFEELVGDNGVYESPAAYPAPGTFRIVIDVYHQVVLAYTRDANGAYTVPARFMVCSTGAQKTPTPRGTFASGSHKVRFGLFVNDGVYGQYWTQITNKIYFHSLLYTKKDANSYTSSYSKLGQRASHGCVRLLVPDARWIYYHIAPGTEVEIRRGSKEDLETAFIKENLTRPKRPKNRPGLIPGNVPDTDNWNSATYLERYARVASANA
ncbi:MAG TPA: L,D-transpeptidase [Feifaniaceae bacterium]|nr:L,D-transpeptidase [Feifaniaceae bacterium]